MTLIFNGHARYAIKKKAKQTLTGHWRDAILTALPQTLALHFLAFLLGLVGYGLLLSWLWPTSRTAAPDSTVTTSSSDIGPYALQIIFTLLFLGTTFAAIEWVRHHDAPEVWAHPFKKQVQIFTPHYFWGALFLKLVTDLLLLFWTSLFVIPGILKFYAYRMTYYVFKDAADQTDGGRLTQWFSCITASRFLMRGHKLELFWLDISFLGWHLLNLATLGFLSYYVIPYQQVAYAAFYNRLAHVIHIEPIH